MSVIYCQRSAIEEVARTPSHRKWKKLRGVALGLVPVVDGRCSYCGKKVRVVQ